MLRAPTVPSAFTLAIVLVSASGLPQEVLRRPVTMQELTAPKDLLPAGCALKALEPVRQSTSPVPGTRVPIGNALNLLQPPGVTTNPWTGSNRRVLATIRSRIAGYGPLRMPDAPPLTMSEQSALTLHYADGVDEGYAATYAQVGAREIAVWAVRFAVTPDSNLRENARDRANLQNAVRIEIGSIWAVLYGDRGPCSRAVATYLESLSK
jgi:hypothetical protein